MSKCALCEGEDVRAFCFACQQHLCDACKTNHSKDSSTRTHLIKETTCEHKRVKVKSNECDNHEGKPIELYCCDCKKFLCSLCHATDHNKHLCKTPSDVAKSKTNEISKYKNTVEKFIKDEETMIKNQKTKSDLYLEEISKVEKYIDDSLEELINHFSKQKTELMKTFKNIKETHSNIFDSENEKSEFRCAELCNFLAKTKMVVERGTDCEIVGVVDELHKRAEELTKEQEKRNRMDKSAENSKFLNPVTSEIRELKNLMLKTDLQRTLDSAIKTQNNNGKPMEKAAISLNGFQLEFTTVSGIKVKIDKGNIVNQAVDAIVNTTRASLIHVGGVAGAISEACGRDLTKESDEHIRHHGKLKIGEPTHTTSGKLYPRVKHVVHVLGPDGFEVKDEQKCQELLLKSFYNCFIYSNTILKAKSIAIPAISSGRYGIPTKVVAQCACDALVKYEADMAQLKDEERHLKQIIFVDIDDKTVSAMHSSFTELLKKNPGCSNKSGNQADTNNAATAEARNDDCSICTDKITDPKTLSCKHKFCKDCIDQWIKTKPSCPVCGAMFGALKGNQPEDGTMTINNFPGHLPGYEHCGIIEITYSFRDGIQDRDHPNPGSRYQGTMRKAYLPDNEEGQEVLKLLQEAFKARLVFTIGKSVTTGRDNVVTWNDIHHKTSTRGGEFGYPDPTYLKRVRDELAAKGIKP